MMGKRRIGMVLAICLVMCGVAIQAKAQQAIKIESLTIQLWPEYDRAAMLVQYTGVVADAGNQVTLSFTLPESAVVHVTAFVDPSNGYVEVENTVKGNQVTMVSPNGMFHIEFYDAALETSSADRSYHFAWAGDYAVATLNYSVQRPPTATEMKITPDAGEPTLASDGLNYYVVKVTDLAKGESAPITVAYHKPGDALTEILQATETASEPAPPNGALNTALTLIAAMVLVGVGSIVGFFLFQRIKQADERESKRKTSPSSPVSDAQRGGTQAPTSAKFCTNCGAAIQDPNDRFCRNCGKPLKVGLRM